MALDKISNSLLDCHYCKKSIIGKYFIYQNNTYHSSCYEAHIQLRCDNCNKTISGNYNTENGNNYHPKCYKYFILEKCDVCNNPIEGEYINDSWNNIYHSYHYREMPLCESCNQIICNNITDGGFIINGKRNICNICWDDVITNESDIKNVYNYVYKRLSAVGINNLPLDVPIILVKTRNELNKISKIRLGNIQGYTKYEFETIANLKTSKKFTIYILSHLHQVNFHAVLAHELLHIYLFKNNLDLNSKHREGFCNLGAQLIYKSYDNKLSNIKLKGMYEDNDPDYGKGFLFMNELLEKKGWRNLIQYLYTL